MKDLFHKIFGRYPDSREMLVLNRLSRLYGKEVTENAISLSAVVTKGSPINYINTVAFNLSKELPYDYAALKKDTQRRIDEIKEHL